MSASTDHVINLWRSRVTDARTAAIVLVDDEVAVELIQAVEAEAVARYREAAASPRRRAAWQAWSKEEIARLRALYESGVSVTEIGRELGRQNRTIMSACDRYGIARKPKEGTDDGHTGTSTERADTVA